MQLTGRILWYCERDGNGIILTPDNKEWYFDSSVLKFTYTRNATLVTFDHNTKISDCRCACNVQLKG